ncbi:MAG TPA: hypothetical protein VJ832_08125, partial [Variovorax sp.]|nr:hypothetical protein [Variovorax sp.]
ERRSPSDERTMTAAMALIGSAHPAASVEAWRLEGAGLDEDAVVALVSDHLLNAASDPHVRAA